MKLKLHTSFILRRLPFAPAILGRLPFAPAILGLALLPGPVSQAATYYWAGATATSDSLTYASGTWNTTDTAWWPESGSENIAYTSATDSNVLFGGGTVNGKSYAPAAAGSSFTVTLGENISVNTLRLHFNYTGSNLTIAGDGNVLTLAGGTRSIRNDSNASLIIDAIISGSSGIEKAYQGKVIFTQNNTYTGGTTVTGNANVNGGVLQIGNGASTGALGAGAVTIRSAASTQRSWTTLAFYRSDDITVGNNVTFSNAGSGGSYTGGRITNTTGGGIVTLAGPQLVQANATGVYDVNDVTGSAAPDIIISGKLDGAGSLVKTGSGTLAVTSASTTHTGATTINSGIFLMNGTTSGQGAYTITVGATLGGTGTIGTADGDVILEAGAQLAPGDSQQQSTLTFSLGSGSLDLGAAVSGASTGALSFRLGDTASSDSVLLSSGTLLIGTGELDFDDFQFGTATGFGEGVYTLIATEGAQSIIGTFGSRTSGLIDGYQATLGLADGNLTLTVTAIPEASAMILVLCAPLLGVLLYRRPLSRQREHP